jgi:hypothetical protein
VNLAIFLSGRRAWKMLALWFGLVALMVQGLVPLCASGAMGGAVGNIASVVICTSHGFETVQVDGDGKPLPQPPGKSMSDCCSACHAPGGFNLASPLRLTAPSLVAYNAPLFAPAPIGAARFYSSYVTRGPPVSA